MAKAIVTGWKELDAALAGIEPKIQGKALRSALREGAKRIQASAIANIAANPSVDTGKLGSSLKVRAAKRSRRNIGFQIHTKGAAHANLIEYGTKRFPAEPFLRPAGYDNEAKIRAMLLDDIAVAVGGATDRWKFIKMANSSSLTKARKSVRKVVSKNKKIKKAKVAKRFKKFEAKIVKDRKKYLGVK